MPPKGARAKALLTEQFQHSILTASTQLLHWQIKRYMAVVYDRYYSSNALNTTQAFWPPKPKLLDSTVLTCACRALLGT